MTKFWIADVGHQSDIDLRAIGSPTGVNRCAVPGEAIAGDPPNVYFFDLQLKRFIPPPVAVMSQASQEIATRPFKRTLPATCEMFFKRRHCTSEGRRRRLVLRGEHNENNHINPHRSVGPGCV